MNNNIKQVMQLEKLLLESSSPTLLKPDLGKFKQVADLINSNKTLPRRFVALVKSNLSGRKHHKTQLLILELLEYTTINCNMSLHNEYNSKSFLKIINTLFNQTNLQSHVKQKALNLVQFWNKFFESEKDVLPNFNWYFKNIKKRGIPFPPMKPSIYQKNVKKPPQHFNNQPNETQLNQTQKRKRSSNIVSNMTPKQSKLYKDLQVVQENINVANAVITNKEKDMANDLMGRLLQMNKRLGKLPENLSNKGEDFLCEFTLALIDDINQTKTRYNYLKMNRKMTPFISKIPNVIRKNQNKRRGSDSIKKSEDPFGNFEVKKKSKKNRDVVDLLDLNVDVEPRRQKKGSNDSNMFADINLMGNSNSQPKQQVNTKFTNTMGSNQDGSPTKYHPQNLIKFQNKVVDDTKGSNIYDPFSNLDPLSNKNNQQTGNDFWGQQQAQPQKNPNELQGAFQDMNFKVSNQEMNLNQPN